MFYIAFRHPLYGAKYFLKFRVFWDILPCSQIDVDRRLRSACCFHHQEIIALMMEAAHTSETSVNIYLATSQYIPED
jgi:hypothetical protein